MRQTIKIQAFLFLFFLLAASLHPPLSAAASTADNAQTQALVPEASQTPSTEPSPPAPSTEKPLPAPSALPSEKPLPAPSPGQPPLTAIRLSDSELFLSPGDTAQLEIAQAPEGLPKIAFYSSADSSIAEIDEQGLVTAIGAGKTILTVSLNADFTSRCTVTVAERASSISFPSLKDNRLTLDADQSYQLKYVITPEGSVIKDAVWSVRPENIASVSPEGNVKALKAGTAIVTLTVSGKISQSVTVKVREPAAIVRKPSPNLNIVDTSKAKYTYQEMTVDLKALEEAYGDRIKVTAAGSTYDDRSIYEVILGNPDSKKQVFIQSAIHAREYMTSLLTMRTLEYYCQNYYSGTYDGVYYDELFNEVGFHFIPMSNPDGITISQFGAAGIRDDGLRAKVAGLCRKFAFGSSHYYTLWKANARGVDLNRNFDGYWDLQKETPKSPRNLGYPGTRAFSEKESQVLKSRIEEIDPVAVISYHATGSILYWNFGQRDSLYQQSVKLVNTIQELTSYQKVHGYSKNESAGFGDWISVRKQIPTVTIEIGRTSCPLKLWEFSSIWSKNKLVPAAVAMLYYD